MLIEIYPNPASRAFTIEYKIKTPSDVNIKIIGIDGKLRQTIVDKTQTSGSYMYKLSTSGISGSTTKSGLYLIRFKIGSKVFYKKLVVAE